MELITIVWIDPECSWSFTVEYTSWILGVQNKPTDISLNWTYLFEPVFTEKSNI